MSQISIAVTTFDYKDNFSEIVQTARPIRVEELAGRFFRVPQWVAVLMKLRNAIARPLGLKGGKAFSDLLKVETENRVAISKADKHLDCIVTLIAEEIESGKQRMSVSTEVCLHNSFGKLYFAIIKPYHRLICKTQLKRVRKQLESKENAGLTGKEDEV